MRKLIWLGLAVFIVAGVAFYVGRNFGLMRGREEIMLASRWPVDPPFHGSDLVALCASPGDDWILSSLQNGIVAGRRSDACVSYMRGVIWAAGYFQDLNPTGPQVFCNIAALQTPDVVMIAKWIGVNKAASDASAAEAVIKAVHTLYGCKD